MTPFCSYFEDTTSDLSGYHRNKMTHLCWMYSVSMDKLLTCRNGTTTRSGIVTKYVLLSVESAGHSVDVPHDNASILMRMGRCLQLVLCEH